MTAEPNTPVEVEAKAEPVTTLKMAEWMRESIDVIASVIADAEEEAINGEVQEWTIDEAEMQVETLESLLWMMRDALIDLRERAQEQQDELEADAMNADAMNADAMNDV
jgi:hypothetical protein